MIEARKLPFMNIPEEARRVVRSGNRKAESELSLEIKPKSAVEKYGVSACMEQLKHISIMGDEEKFQVIQEITSLREELLNKALVFAEETGYENHFKYLNDFKKGGGEIPPDLINNIVNIRILANSLALGNWRLIIEPIKEASIKYNLNSHDEEDLFQIAFLGLVNACERFDPDYGSSLASYAVSYIKSAIKTSRKDFYTTTIDHSDMSILYALGNARKFLKEKQINTEPSLMEKIMVTFLQKKSNAEITEEDFSELAEKLKYDRKTFVAFRKFKGKAVDLILSLYPLDIEELTQAQELQLATDVESEIESKLEKAEIKKLIREVVDSNILTNDEREFIQVAFGLLDSQDRTITDLAKYFGFTEEMTRIVKAKILRRLKYPVKNRLTTEPTWRAHYSY